jgi:integrase
VRKSNHSRQAQHGNITTMARSPRRAPTVHELDERLTNVERDLATELGIKVKIGCHTFRATGITAYLEARGTLENAQAMAAHESPRITKLYDRTGDQITLDEVERIAI